MRGRRTAGRGIRARLQIATTGLLAALVAASMMAPPASAAPGSPQVSNLVPPASPTNDDPIRWDVDFTAAASVDPTKIVPAGTAQDCVISAANRGAATTWRISATGCSEGTLTLTIKAGTVTSPIGGGSGPSADVTTPEVTIDRTAPVVTIVAPAGPTAARNLQFRVNLGDAITDLAVTGLTVGGTAAGCTVQAPQAAGAWWTVGVTGCGPGTVTLRLASARDAAGNVSPAAELESAPVTIAADAPLDPEASIAGPNNHTCALRDDHTVACWGDNLKGQLGDGSTTRRVKPVAVQGITDAVAVTVGLGFSCALRVGGRVMCWGYNSHGQLGDGTTTDRRTPVEVGGVTTAVAVHAGLQHACALLAGGGIRCWGNNYEGQLGNGEDSVDAPTAVAPSGITGAIDVAPGRYSTCAVLVDGTARCWGYMNYYNPDPPFIPEAWLGDGTKTPSSTPVVVSGVTTATEVAVGWIDACILLADTTVHCWGNGTMAPKATPSLSGAVSLSGISAHFCAHVEQYLGAVDAAACFGSNWYGQLGDGTTNGSATGWNAKDLYTVTAAAAGLEASCARIASGGIRCWGRNTYGQLGDGTVTDRHVRARVVGFGPPPITATITPTTPFTSGQPSFHLAFTRPVKTFFDAGIVLDGTANCDLGTSTGSSAAWVLPLDNCTEGTLTAGLVPDSVKDLAGDDGPPVEVTSPTVVIDRTAPTATYVAAGVATKTQLGTSSIPIAVSVSGADAAAGVGSWDVARSTDGGTTYGTPVTGTASPVRVTSAFTGTTRFRVLARDRAGNPSATVDGPTLTPSVVQQTSSTIKRSGTWTTSASSAASGRSTVYATRAGASASFTVTARSVAFVTTKGPGRGKVAVYVGGRKVVTLDLAATSTVSRSIVWAVTSASPVNRTIKLVVLGTKGRPRVDLDAFVVLK